MNTAMTKKEITINLVMSEIVYDDQNKTYLTGRSRQSADNHEAVANMQANDDEEDKNQVLRSIGNAFGTLKTKLSEYLVSDKTSSNNVQIDEDTNLEVTLQMPSNYNPATVDTISAALHQYIVNTAIAEWFNITNKGDAQEYATLATGNLGLVREAINKRVRPQRPKVNEEGTGTGD
jgi:hypothetical protein